MGQNSLRRNPLKLGDGHYFGKSSQKFGCWTKFWGKFPKNWLLTSIWEKFPNNCRFTNIWEKFSKDESWKNIWEKLSKNWSLDKILRKKEQKLKRRENALNF